MKKVILSSLVLSGFLFACDKANVQDYPSGTNSTQSLSLKTQGDPPKELKRSRDVNGKDVFCDNPGFTCRLDNMINPNDLPSVLEVIGATPSTLKAVFAANRSLLSSYFSEMMVDGIISGTLRLEINGSFADGGLVYFSFYDGPQFLQCAPLGK